jgi:hypothetical protein
MSANSKKETWKMVINMIISVLTAIATTLGVTSCMSAAREEALGKSGSPEVIWKSGSRRSPEVTEVRKSGQMAGNTQFKYLKEFINRSVVDRRRERRTIS